MFVVARFICTPASHTCNRVFSAHTNTIQHRCFYRPIFAIVSSARWPSIKHSARRGRSETIRIRWETMRSAHNNLIDISFAFYFIDTCANPPFAWPDELFCPFSDGFLNVNDSRTTVCGLSDNWLTTNAGQMFPELFININFIVTNLWNSAAMVDRRGLQMKWIFHACTLLMFILNCTLY